MSGQCPGIKRDGGRCTVIVNGPQEYCYAHDPARSEERRRAASKAGRSRPNRELADIKGRLSDLTNGVLEGRVDKGVGGVASQILNVYLRAITVELKVREVEDLERRLEELETLLDNQTGGRSRWG